MSCYVVFYLISTASHLKAFYHFFSRFLFLFSHSVSNFSHNLFFFLHPVLMKDRCKLFCRVAGTTAYYQLKDRVIDGTPCGPDTYDICVQGLCRVYLSVSLSLINLCNHTHTAQSFIINVSFQPWLPLTISYVVWNLFLWVTFESNFFLIITRFPFKMFKLDDAKIQTELSQPALAFTWFMCWNCWKGCSFSLQWNVSGSQSETPAFSKSICTSPGKKKCWQICS